MKKCGFLCEPWWNSWYSVPFDIIDCRTGVTKSQFKKTTRGFLKELVYNADKFEIFVRF